MRWHQAIAEHARDGRPYVIATVLATSGSAPRPAGTKMVVTARGSDDSIGGGQLEYLVIERARAMLDGGVRGAAVHHFPLAAAALQCCGGSVTVLLESFARPRLDVAVFGAGHVGRRVVALLDDLDARVRWFDSRAGAGAGGGAAGASVCRVVDDPVAVVDELDVGQEVLVLTHDHQLDYALIAALLRRGFGNVGLIGSATKWRRFRTRLGAEGLAPADVDRVRCPVGRGAPGKEPMAVAISIVAELLERAPARADALPGPSGLSWRQIKESLVQDSGG